jgi:hypothetical protein
MEPGWPRNGPRWPLIRALRELYHVNTNPLNRRYLDTVLGYAGALAPLPPPVCPREAIQGPICSCGYMLETCWQLAGILLATCWKLAGNLLEVVF